MGANYILDTIEILREEVEAEGGSLPADELAKAYALLALTTGTGTTLENVHDAWGMWRAFSDRPDHGDLLWFPALPIENATWDRPYRDAIRRTAARLEILREKATGVLV